MSLNLPVLKTLSSVHPCKAASLRSSNKADFGHLGVHNNSQAFSCQVLFHAISPPIDDQRCAGDIPLTGFAYSIHNKNYEKPEIGKARLSKNPVQELDFNSLPLTGPNREGEAEIQQYRV
jgi:hypothetical protein